MKKSLKRAAKALREHLDRDFETELAWLVKHRRREVELALAGFSSLARGRQMEMGPIVAYFASLLEAELEKQPVVRPSKLKPKKVRVKARVIR